MRNRQLEMVLECRSHASTQGARVASQRESSGRVRRNTAKKSAKTRQAKTLLGFGIGIRNPFALVC